MEDEFEYFKDGGERAASIQFEPVLSRRSIRLVLLGTALLGLGAAAAVWISGAEDAEETCPMPVARVKTVSNTRSPRPKSSARESAAAPGSSPAKIETYDDAPDLD